MRTAITFSLSLGLALLLLTSAAQADMAPPNSRFIKHTATFHGAKAFPKYRFVLVGGSYHSWPAPDSSQRARPCPSSSLAAG